MSSSEKLVVILGQTATGKTALAIELARKHNGAIICADSRTIYKGMDIGTAKPSQVEQNSIQHYLLDVVEPNQSFSVVEFKTLCQKYIAKIREEGKVPIIVGGSGLYLDAFLYDYKFRNTTGLDVSEMTDDQKLELAQELYPQEILKIDSKNIRRVEQLLTRGPVNTNDRRHIKIACKIIGLELDKLTLRQNIEKRTKAMLNNGFVQEVEKLRSKYGKDCPALLTTGYKEVSEYLDKIIEKSKLEPEIVASTLRLAKKQATWFKRNQSIEWFNSPQKAIATIEQYLGEV
jgi:tRNA dimethylallyltransferase